MVPFQARLAALTLAALVSACSIVRVDSDSDPARIESRGLIRGHAAVGIPAEDHLLHLDLFDGTSKGSVVELIVWRLFRFELGLAGATIGVGPFSLGLGIFFYDAKTPEMLSQKKAQPEADDSAQSPADDGVIEAGANADDSPSE